MTGRLDGRVAVITGTASGQGRAAAELFASEGAIVVGCDVDAAGSAETAYKSRQPVFQTVLDSSAGLDPASAGVRVAGIVESKAEPVKMHDPGNPLADADGYVYMSNVNPVDELVNMISASRSYQNSVEVLSTSKELLMRTLNLGS